MAPKSRLRRHINLPNTLLLLSCIACAVGQAFASAQPDYFRIHVVDDETGRGVPLVELVTTSNIKYYTDSNGNIAFREPGMMGQPVFFQVSSHGYEYPEDGFGFRGKKLTPIAGANAELRIKRTNVAERLYRITGQGIYRDSVLLGLPSPIEEPLLNARVTGQDTVMMTPYRGRLFWFWGDTNRVAYPLGHFATSGATSEWPGKGGLDPSVGVNLHYFVNETGFSKKMCPIEGPGPVWIGGLMTISSSDGEETLLAQYARIKELGVFHERGLVRFNDEIQQFEKVKELPVDGPLFPRGHPFRVSVSGEEYYYFSLPHPLPFPNVRVKADLDSILDPNTYEVFTCLTPGSRYNEENPPLDLGQDGQPRYGWKTGAEPLGYEEQQESIKNERLQPEQSWLHLTDVDTGKTVQAHSGSVSWNEFRKRWVMIALERFGSSVLGEIWYAEADTPVGPWVYAKKVVSHDKYSFYNPKHHACFDRDGGRVIYLEGTYTATFSGNSEQTPRYDYNQIMYRLTLDDPRLSLPAPVYQVKTVDGTSSVALRPRVCDRAAWENVEGVPFYAVPPDRHTDELVAVFADERTGRLLVVHNRDGGNNVGVRHLFSAVSLGKRTRGGEDEEAENPAVVPLYEYRNSTTSRYHYSTDPEISKPGWIRSPEPVCGVWRNPMSWMAIDPGALPVPMLRE